MRKIIFSLLAVVLVSTIAIGATRAYFTSESTSAGNIISTGTIHVKDVSESWMMPVTFNNLKPGDLIRKWVRIQNDGTTDIGSLTVSAVNIHDDSGLFHHIIGWTNVNIIGTSDDSSGVQTGYSGDAELLLNNASLFTPATEWLSDAKETHGWIRNHAHVHVSGHVHEAESGELRAGSGTQFVHVVAGAVHGERMPKGVPASHGYNHGAVVHDGQGGLELRVWPRRWSEPNKDFRVDGDSVPRGKEFATHRLTVRVAIPPKVALEVPITSSASTPAHVVPTAAPGPIPTGPLPMFISYAPADKAALERLEVFLKPLKREGLVATWSAAQVGGGAEARVEAAQRLADARVVLLMVSPDFMASDECHDVEMTTAVARHDRHEARVIPILLQNADFESAPFAKLQFLPWFRQGQEPARPVYGAADRDAAFHEIVVAIRKEIEALRGAPRAKR